MNEINARELLTKIVPTAGAPPIELVVESHIIDESFYVFADPSIRPAWVSGHLGG